jgi:hypothetical protein
MEVKNRAVPLSQWIFLLGMKAITKAPKPGIKSKRVNCSAVPNMIYEEIQ